ncbi:hypothetical protein N784_04540 [Pontibacillus litoralis JSM 072002]|uniref:Competence protein n=2 Tax=Pontibacillus TaxID=289201 RepID=A0A0A5G5Q5_9BACI|nr:hypothetical protein N784_04540 [Pontibacillus litoralis JSM 072002]
MVGIMKSSQYCSTYVVTEQTMGIFWNQDIEYASRIIEAERIIYCKKTSAQIVAESCNVYGASLQQRRDSMKHVLASRSKLPIAIDPKSCIFMFPTRSPRSIYCNWISFYQVHQCKDVGEGTMFIFNDLSTVTVPATASSLRKQMHRTAMGIAYYMKESMTQPTVLENND